jgi:hypothetical protein
MQMLCSAVAVEQMVPRPLLCIFFEPHCGWVALTMAIAGNNTNSKPTFPAQTCNLSTVEKHT